MIHLIKEDYVSPSTEAVLRKIGFNNYNHALLYSVSSKIYHGLTLNEAILNNDVVQLPTLYNAQMWLLRKHNIAITVFPFFTNEWGVSASMIVHKQQLDGSPKLLIYRHTSRMFSTYTATLNYAIHKICQIILRDMELFETLGRIFNPNTMSCSECAGYGGNCPVCEEEVKTTPCEECNGTGKIYYVGEKVVTKDTHDKVFVLVPAACYDERCEVCDGDGEIIEEPDEYERSDD